MAEDSGIDLAADLEELNDDSSGSDGSDETKSNSETQPEETKEEGKEESPEVKDEDTTEEEKEDEDYEEDENLPRTHRPSIKEVKTKYPNLFKDFPEIKSILFRESAYADEFPTISDAKEAKEKADIYEYINNDITQGNAENFLSAVKETGNADKFVESFIPSLYKVDQDLYYKTITPVIQSLIRSIHADGKRKGDDNLVNTALVALEYCGFETGILDGRVKKEDPKTSSKEEELNNREKEINTRLFTSALSDVESSVLSQLDSLIDSMVKEENLTEYEKKSMKRDMLSAFNEVIGADKKHIQLMDSMWEKASKAGYNREWKDRISSTYLSRAKSVLPAVRTRVRKEVLGNRTEKVVKPEKTEKPVVRSSSPVRSSNKPQRMKSDLDILNEP